MKLQESLNQQQQTLMPIIKTLLRYGIYFIAFILMLRAFEINPLPLLAGAGVSWLGYRDGCSTPYQ